jgi:hypothetical protein
LILNDYFTLAVFWLVSAAFLAGFVDARVGGGFTGFVFCNGRPATIRSVGKF